jgi:hypothetical protein
MSLFVFSIIVGFLVHQFLSVVEIKHFSDPNTHYRSIEFGSGFVTFVSASFYKVLVFIVWGFRGLPGRASRRVRGKEHIVDIGSLQHLFK